MSKVTNKELMEILRGFNDCLNKDMCYRLGAFKAQLEWTLKEDKKELSHEQILMIMDYLEI